MVNLAGTRYQCEDNTDWPDTGTLDIYEEGVKIGYIWPIEFMGKTLWYNSLEDDLRVYPSKQRAAQALGAGAVNDDMRLNECKLAGHQRGTEPWIKRRKRSEDKDSENAR